MEERGEGGGKTRSRGGNGFVIKGNDGLFAHAGLMHALLWNFLSDAVAVSRQLWWLVTVRSAWGWVGAGPSVHKTE